MSIARGSFEVTVTPLEPSVRLDGAVVNSWSIEKSYSGDLIAAARGTMLGAGDPARGSAGYVAVEQVRGTLLGRKGSFALQHTATMNAGASELSIIVVPGSSTGELTGISGRLKIEMVDGKHLYRFDYELP